MIKPNKAAKFHLTETDSGLDLLVHADGEPGPEVYKAGGDLVADLDLARLVWNKEPILTIREPMLRMAGLPVTIPPGAFLQATSESQEAMTQAVLEACPDGISKAMDLYSGLGAFGLALAAKADKVVAVEGLSPATAALDKALRGTPLHPKLDIFTRDLELWPLTAKEMEDADLVVFDPPRAGAKAQAPIIAAAEPKTVIAISCNPATFSRDLVPFQRAGYQLSWAKAFDQFLYSAHLEVMAVLKKP